MPVASETLAPAIRREAESVRAALDLLPPSGRQGYLAEERQKTQDLPANSSVLIARTLVLAAAHIDNVRELNDRSPRDHQILDEMVSVTTAALEQAGEQLSELSPASVKLAERVSPTIGRSLILPGVWNDLVTIRDTRRPFAMHPLERNAQAAGADASVFALAMGLRLSTRANGIIRDVVMDADRYMDLNLPIRPLPSSWAEMVDEIPDALEVVHRAPLLLDRKFGELYPGDSDAARKAIAAVAFLRTSVMPSGTAAPLRQALFGLIRDENWAGFKVAMTKVVLEHPDWVSVVTASNYPPGAGELQRQKTRAPKPQPMLPAAAEQWLRAHIGDTFFDPNNGRVVHIYQATKAGSGKQRRAAFDVMYFDPIMNVDVRGAEPTATKELRLNQRGSFSAVEGTKLAYAARYGPLVPLGGYNVDQYQRTDRQRALALMIGADRMNELLVEYGHAAPDDWDNIVSERVEQYRLTLQQSRDRFRVISNPTALGDQLRSDLAGHLVVANVNGRMITAKVENYTFAQQITKVVLREIREQTDGTWKYAGTPQIEADKLQALRGTDNFVDIADLRGTLGHMDADRIPAEVRTRAIAAGDQIMALGRGDLAAGGIG